MPSNLILNSHPSIPRNLISLPARALILVIFIISMGCGSPNDAEVAEEYYQAGLKALETKTLDDAVILFKKAIQRQPKHAQAYFQLGRIYARSDTPEKIKMAAVQFSQAIQADPDFNEARKALAKLCFDYHNYKIAIPLCQELIERKAEDVEVLLILGKSLANIGNMDEAVNILPQAVDLAPKNHHAKIGLALALFGDQQPEKALAMMQAAAAQAPDDMIAQLYLARLYHKMKQFTQAESTYQAIIKQFPDQAPPYHYLANFYWSQEKLDDLESVFKKLIRQYPDNPTPYRILSYNYYKRQQFEAAENVINQAIRTKKIKNVHLYYDLARQYHHRHLYDKALQTYQAALKNFPDRRQCWIVLAEYHVFQKQFEKARAVFAQIYTKWPDFIYAQSRRAEIYFDQAQDENALEITNQILTEYPQNAKIRLLRGKIKMKAGEYDQAREDFQAVRSQETTSPLGDYYYALTLMAEEDFQTAEIEIEQALAKNANSWKIRQTMAEVYFKNAKYERALDEINFVLDMQSRRLREKNAKARNLSTGMRELITQANLRAFALRAAIYIKLKRFEEAALDYETIIHARPDSPRLQFHLAKLYEIRGETDQALKHFMAIKSSYPQPLQPLQEIIKIYNDRKAYQKALVLCDEALQKHPGNLEMGQLKALLLVKQKKYDASLKLLKTLIRQHPQSDRPLIAMAAIHIIQKDETAALDMFQKAIKINPKNKTTYMRLASLHKQRGETDQAIAAYEALLDAVGSYPPAENDLAYLYAQSNRNLDRALKLALNARKKMPRRPEIADTVGYIYLQRNSPVQAAKYLREALDSNLENPYIYYHWGLLQQQEKNYDSAQEAFQKALALGLGPDERTDVHKRMAALQAPFKAWPETKRKILKALDEQRLDDAIAAAEKSHQLMPNHADVADILGWVYLNKGTIVRATQALRQAIEKAPRNPLYHFHLGAAFYEEGHYSEARNALKRALDLGLKGNEALTSRKLLNVMNIVNTTPKEGEGTSP